MAAWSWFSVDFSSSRRSGAKSLIDKFIIGALPLLSGSWDLIVSPFDLIMSRGVRPLHRIAVSRAHNMSGLVAHDLSGSHVYLGGEHEADGIATGGPEDAIRGGLRRMAAREAYPGGGGPGPGGFRPDVPPLCGTV